MVGLSVMLAVRKVAISEGERFTYAIDGWGDEAIFEIKTDGVPMARFALIVESDRLEENFRFTIFLIVAHTDEAIANDDATLDGLLTELSSVSIIKKLCNGAVAAVSLQEGAVELVLMRARENDLDVAIFEFWEGVVLTIDRSAVLEEVVVTARHDACCGCWKIVYVRDEDVEWLKRKAERRRNFVGAPRTLAIEWQSRKVRQVAAYRLFLR